MIVTLPGVPVSNSQLRIGAKAWIKLLTGVDTSKSDGYAFLGTFEKFGGMIECEPGTFFLAYWADRTGSGSPRDTAVRLYRAEEAPEEDNLVTVHKWDFSSRAGWALMVRDEIAALIDPAIIAKAKFDAIAAGVPLIPRGDGLVPAEYDLLCRAGTTIIIQCDSCGPLDLPDSTDWWPVSDYAFDHASATGHAVAVQVTRTAVYGPENDRD